MQSTIHLYIRMKPTKGEIPRQMTVIGAEKMNTEINCIGQDMPSCTNKT